MLELNHKYKAANFSERNPESVIDKIILHSIAYDLEKAMEAITTVECQVSAHYLIDIDGTIYQMVDDELKAWHAGKSFWQDEEALNDSSIGIEMINNWRSDFSESQINSLNNLIAEICTNYPIQKIMGHGDIAVPYCRRTDPGIYFPWDKLEKNELLIDQGKCSNYALDKNQILYCKHNHYDELVAIKYQLKKIGYKVNNVDDYYDQDFADLMNILYLRFQPEILKPTIEMNDYINLTMGDYFYGGTEKLIYELAELQNNDNMPVIQQDYII